MRVRVRVRVVDRAGGENMTDSRIKCLRSVCGIVAPSATDLDADVIVKKCTMKSTKSVGGSCGDTFAWTRREVLDLDDKTPQQP